MWRVRAGFMRVAESEVCRAIARIVAEPVVVTNASSLHVEGKHEQADVLDVSVRVAADDVGLRDSEVRGLRAAGVVYGRGSGGAGEVVWKRESVVSEVLSPAEEAMMKHTFAVTMKRAAEVIDAITDDDVLDAARVLLAEGMSLAQVAKIDRAMLGSAHLRACALNLDPQQASTIKRLLSENVQG